MGSAFCSYSFWDSAHAAHIRSPAHRGGGGSQRKGVFQTNHLGDAGVSIDLVNIFFFTMFIH